MSEAVAGFPDDDTLGASSKSQSIEKSGPKLAESTVDEAEEEDERDIKIRALEESLQNEKALRQKDIEQLQLIISDLTRRLHNAQHTVDAQKRIASNATRASSRFRDQIGGISNALRMEVSRNTTLLRKQTQGEEARRFDRNKKKAAKMQEDVRMAILDHGMQGLSRPSQKVQKMKQDIKKMEMEHESQKTFLASLGELDKMTEALTRNSQEGHTEEVFTLLKKGANPNEMDAAGYLPLHYACLNGHYGVVKILLEFGTDPTVYLSGYSALEIAARGGFTKICKLLLQFGAHLEEGGHGGSTPLVSAAGGNHVDTVYSLIEAGANVNGMNLDQNTALHIACTVDKPIALIRLLLKSEAALDTINAKGYTPVRMALEQNNALAVEALGGRTRASDLADAELDYEFVPDENENNDDGLRDDESMSLPSLNNMGANNNTGLGYGSVTSSITFNT